MSDLNSRDSPPDDTTRSPLDYSAASNEHGSHVDDRGAPTDHDGRGTARTDFYPDDVPMKENHYDRLLSRHKDVGESQRRGQNRAAYKRKFIDTLAAQLDATDYQQRRATHLIEQIDVQNIHSRASIEGLALALLTLVLNEDYRFVRQEDQYDDIRADLDIDTSRIRDLRQKLREADAIGIGD